MIFHDLEVDCMPEWKRIPRLSAITGANVLITTLQVPPATEILVKKHVDAGAVFVRVHTAPQLMEVEGEQLLGALAKLISLGVKSWQAILLIDSSSKLLDFDRYIAKAATWVEHGGSALDTYGNPTVMFLSKWEQRFVKVKTDKSITFVHPRIGPRSQIEMVRDYRVTLATFPGIGIKGANIIQKQINERNLGNDLLTAMIYMTEERKLTSGNDQLVKIVKLCREWLGLPDGFDLDIKFNGVDEDTGDGNSA